METQNNIGAMKNVCRPTATSHFKSKENAFTGLHTLIVSRYGVKGKTRKRGSRDIMREERETAASVATLPALLTLRCCGDLDTTAPFLVSWNEGRPTNTLSFREFGARVHVGVLRLRRQGIDKGMHVGVLAHNSVDLWALSSAIICCDAVCVLLNYRQPLAALVTMSDAARVNRLLTSGSLSSLALQLKERAHGIEDPLLLMAVDGVTLDSATVDVSTGGDVAEAVARGTAAFNFANSQPDPHATVVIFYTSGSTSTPKPVAHSHASLLWSRQQESDWFRCLHHQICGRLLVDPVAPTPGVRQEVPTRTCDWRILGQRLHWWLRTGRRPAVFWSWLPCERSHHARRSDG